MSRQWCIGQYHPSGVVPLLLPSALLCPVTSHNLLRLSEDNDTKDKDKQDNSSEDNINDKDNEKTTIVKTTTKTPTTTTLNATTTKRIGRCHPSGVVESLRSSVPSLHLLPLLQTPALVFFFLRNFLSVVLISESDPRIQLILFVFISSPFVCLFVFFFLFGENEHNVHFVQARANSD